MSQRILPHGHVTFTNDRQVFQGGQPSRARRGQPQTPGLESAKEYVWLKCSQASTVDALGKNPRGPPGEALAMVEAWNQRVWPSSDPQPEWTWPKGQKPKTLPSWNSTTCIDLAATPALVRSPCDHPPNLTGQQELSADTTVTHLI